MQASREGPFCSDSCFILTSTGSRDTKMIPPYSMASFLYFIKFISTGPLRGIGIFWCLSALCCQVPWASTLPLPMHWQLAYRNESSGVPAGRLLRYERSSRRHPFVSCSCGTAEFFNHTEVQSHIPGQYHPILAYFKFLFLWG